jgi:serine-type D-Ala-D-Ala carboxypeptidase (penicillin-binding protein 5/6)
MAMNIRSLMVSLWVLLCWLGLPVSAQEAEVFESIAPHAILIDSQSGAVLFEKEADIAVPPASMSKLVTQAVVFDLLEKKKIADSDDFQISEDAWRRGGSPSGGSTMYAELNSKVSVLNLLKAAIIQSANDACIALAEGTSGSEPAFVDLMTAKAKELGLKNSSFGNTTGLPDPKQLMSVRDLATVAVHIIKEYPERFVYYKEPKFTWNNIEQQNRNPLLRDYAGADGMKTGFTKEAGYGLVGTAFRSNRRLVLVLAGLKTAKDRADEAKRLLDWGFRQFKPVDLFAARETVTQARVWGGEKDWVDLVTRDGFTVALTDKERASVEVKLNYKGPLMAPVKPGEVVGTVQVYVSGKAVASVPVETIDAIGAVDSMWQRAWDSVKMMVLGG